MYEKDIPNVMAMLEGCEKISSFTSDCCSPDDFYTDKKTFDAVLMNFVVIGESAGRISHSTKHEASFIPWRQIQNFRNILAHNYFGVDAEEVWQIIQNQLPQLRQQLSDLLKNR
ncbi:MAG TPA: DUF86 domain-containing protein [Saprospiraceae bacterium]|nr:DUF86 domain-containing protein [Saprospiraceae bacterium]